MLHNPVPIRDAVAALDRILVEHGVALAGSMKEELELVRTLLAGPPETAGAPELDFLSRTPGIDERRHPRIEYAPFAGPRLVIGREEYEVTDCAVEGLRFCIRNQEVPAVGSPVKGCVHFWSGSTVTVGGVVLRVGGGEGVLHLTEIPVPEGVLAAEERYLRMNYPPESYRKLQILAPSGAVD
jgi:hypothetical protein